MQCDARLSRAAMVTCPPEYGASTAKSCKPAKVTVCHGQRHSFSQLLDPDDLARRLSLVLAQQNAQAPSKGRTIFRAAWRTSQVPAGLYVSEALDSDPGNQQRHPAHRHGTHGVQQGGLRHKHRLHLTNFNTSAACIGKGGEPVQSSNYRHVPQVAASQFVRTTIADGTSDRKLVHRLSRKAFRFHQDEPDASRRVATASPKVAPCKQAQALPRVQRHYGRSQFHYTPTLATMAEVDEQRPLRHHRHTLEPCSKAGVEGLEPQTSSTKRRQSTGNIHSLPDASARGSFVMPVSSVAVDVRSSDDTIDPSEHHPVDWTQSDESWPQPTAAVASQYPLRKLELKWDLRDRLGSLSRHAKDEKTQYPPREERVAQNSTKQGGGLFARFRRQSSPLRV